MIAVWIKYWVTGKEAGLLLT